MIALDSGPRQLSNDSFKNPLKRGSNMPAANQLSPKRSANTATDSVNQTPWTPAYGEGAKLDNDTINYIHRIYCRECRMEEQKKKEQEERGETGEGSSGNGAQPISPPIEEQSLQQTMDINKETLKRKLMLRRSVTELVDQGIYPPLKTPPAFAEQRKHLMKAQVTDHLRHKIQTRPKRESLVEQHILLEDTKIDPSLQQRQSQLKRAKLVDSLSDKLATRPGPVELVAANILQIDDLSLQHAIKEGKVHYSKTAEAEDPRDRVRHSYVYDDEDSSEGLPSPEQLLECGDISPATSISVTFPQAPNIPTPPDITPLLLKKPTTIVPQHGTRFQFVTPPITTQSFIGSSTSTPVSAPQTFSNKSSSVTGGGGKAMSVSKMRKQKHKPQPKSKVIKFHEYKGPPSAVKTTPPPPPPITNPMNTDSTPYHILLQQQQLFLQWQLEVQHQQKNTTSIPFILPAKGIQMTPGGATTPPSAAVTPAPTPPPLPTGMDTGGSVAASKTTASFTITSPTATPTTLTASSSAPTLSSAGTTGPQNSNQANTTAPKAKTLEDLKVADLKVECKKRNLPVSGPKPNLINRLQLYTQEILLEAFGHGQGQGQSQGRTKTSSSSLSDVSLTSPQRSPVMPNLTSPASVGSYHNPPSVGSIQSLQSPQSNQGMKSLQSVSPGSIIQVQTYQNPGSVPSIANPGSVQNNQNPGSVHSITNPPSVGSVGTFQSPVNSYQNPPSVGSYSNPPSIGPPSVNSLNSILNLQPVTPQSVHNDGDASMCIMSPPMSPANALLDLNLPSPESSMDVTSFVQHQQQQQNAFLMQSNTAQQQQLQQQQNEMMVVDQISRPPSVAPECGMDIDLNASQTNLAALASLDQNQNPQNAQVINIAVQPQGGNIQTVGSQPVVLSQNMILQHQQKQIEDLQRQLQMSQLQLQAQQAKGNTMGLSIKEEQTLLQPQTIAALQQAGQASAQVQAVLGQKTLDFKTLKPLKTEPPSPPASSASLASALTQSVNPAQTVASQPMYIKVEKTQPTVVQQRKVENVAPIRLATTGKDSKLDVKALLQAQVLGQNLNQAIPKVFQFTTNGPINGQPFIFTSKPNAVSTAKTSTVGAPTVNGTVNGVNNNKSSSVPCSPVEHQKLQRSATNPFLINVPDKDPPKYDEAMKNKQNLIGHLQKGSDGTTAIRLNKHQKNSTIKGHTMDDLFDILISTGELPASAAQEPPPTPKSIVSKTSATTATVTNSGTMVQPQKFVPIIHPSGSTIVIPASQAPYMQFSTPVILPNGSLVYTSSLEAATSTQSSMPSGTVVTTTSVPSIQTSINQQKELTHTVTTSSKTTVPGPLDLVQDHIQDFEFIHMDWSDSDSHIGGNPLDLPDLETSNLILDTSHIGLQHKNTTQELLNIPTTVNQTENQTSGGSIHGSESNLNNIGITIDPELAEAAQSMNIDVSDWLDIIMPSSGNTPLSATAPVNFPSDPILTPRPQDVLDVFNMEESDLYTPTDCGLSFEKAMEATSTKS